MDRIDLGDARARIDELIERAEAGETVEITRDGKAVVRLSGVSGERPDRGASYIDRFTELTARMSTRSIDGAVLVRQMRDDGRY